MNTMHYPNVIVDSDAPPVSDPPAHVADHYRPLNFSDRFALGATKFLRLLADLCFRQHYIHRAVVLETVAAVPGMVGATLQQMQALRLLRGRPDMVKLLIDESENERMHLMTFVSMCQPNMLERGLILLSQGLFFNGFFLLYLLSPYTAHRLVGYFEEEAVVSYTRFLQAIDEGKIADRSIPLFAREYWNLGDDATLRDLVIAVRRDEMHHRDVNHHLSVVVVA